MAECVGALCHERVREGDGDRARVWVAVRVGGEVKVTLQPRLWARLLAARIRCCIQRVGQGRQKIPGEAVSVSEASPAQQEEARLAHMELEKNYRLNVVKGCLALWRLLISF